MIKFLVLTHAILLISGSTYSQMLSDLSEYRWQNRLVLLFAPHVDNTQYQQQYQLLHDDQSGLDERDLLIFSVLPNRVIEDGDLATVEQATKLRKHYRVSDAAFLIVLIGKDGSEKMRSDKVVPREELYALIDAMPMRRREMNRD